MERCAFKLRGDSLDSSKRFLQATLSLQRKYNVQEFLEAPNVADPEPFSDHAGTKERQKANLNNFYDEISNMAGTITVETIRDSIEGNAYEDVELNTVTRKIRQLLVCNTSAAKLSERFILDDEKKSAELQKQGFIKNQRGPGEIFR